jgi:hypothetical protein
VIEVFVSPVLGCADGRAESCGALLKQLVHKFLRKMHLHGNRRLRYVCFSFLLGQTDVEATLDLLSSLRIIQESNVKSFGSTVIPCTSMAFPHDNVLKGRSFAPGQGHWPNCESSVYTFS